MCVRVSVCASVRVSECASVPCMCMCHASIQVFLMLSLILELLDFSSDTYVIADVRSRMDWQADDCVNLTLIYLWSGRVKWAQGSED